MRKAKYICSVVLLVVALSLSSVTEAVAQYHPERGLVRRGNELFDHRNFRSSLNRYNEALEYDSLSYEALYNRANAYYQTRVNNPADSTFTAEQAFRYYEDIASDELLDDAQRAEVLRNLGESLFSEKRYEAALNAFRESLLLNPADAETKYDYMLTKRIVEQKRSQKQQQQQNDDNQQQQNEDSQDQQNSQDNSEGEDNRDNRQQEDNPQDDGGEEQNENNTEPEERESPSEPTGLNSDQERMLDAIQAEEDKTQEKLKEGEKVLVIPGKKNW